MPGYFWARTLSASSDLAERLALSAALSITLVPATILIPARIFGTGVTLAATISCALLVLGAGLAAYLRFGPAKGPDEPLAPPPGPLGTPALVLLLPTLGLALVVASGLSYELFVYVGVTLDAWYAVWILPSIALLLVFAAVVQAILSRRNRTEPPPDPSAQAGRPATRYLLLSAALALVLVRGYVGPVLLEWPFIRGVDHYSHAVMANLMMTRGTVESYLVYPPGFHTMTAMISHLSGLRPLEVFPVLGPALLVLPPLALYVLASRLWGWRCGIAAALISGLLVGGSYHYFEDAMYPNLVAAQFLLVLALSALFRLCDAPSVRGGLLLALLGSAVVLYHPVASMYEALLLAAISLSFLPYLLLRDRRRGLALFLSLALLFVLSVLYAWDTYDLPQAVTGLLLGESETGRGGEAVGMALGTQLPFGIESLFATVTLPVMVFGLLGALLLVANPWRRGGTPYVLARATLLAWCLLLFVGSRTPLSAFPQRFERDLGIPLALLAAFALVAVLRSVGWREPLVLLAAGLTAVLGLYGAQLSFSDAAAPSWRMVMTPPIAEAGAWLEEHNEGGNILVSPHLWNQVPSRMMLAMGDYSALQSFDEGQLRVPRDLPPSWAAARHTVGPLPPRRRAHARHPRKIRRPVRRALQELPQ